MRKILFLIPLSFALIATVTAENNEIARGGGGGGGGHAGGGDRAGDRAGDRGDLNRGDLNRNDGYGGGVYYNGGYSPVLLPDPVLTPNDDMDSLYEQNLKSMRKTGQ